MEDDKKDPPSDLISKSTQDATVQAPTINYTFVVQNITTSVEGSNIESLVEVATSRQLPDQTKVNREICGGTDPKDITWLSHDVAMFNKQRLSLHSNARVYRGRQLFGATCRDVAIKLIQYSEMNMKEIENLSKLNHPNIVQIYCAGECNKVGHDIYIVMELCAKNLEQYLRDTPPHPEKAFSILRQLLSAVDFMHRRNIAHRDIKPNNILVSKCGDFVKFSDFGISKEIPQGLTSVTNTTYGAGTEGFKAPELYKPNCKVSLSSDIFSLGLIAVYLFSNGKHPFGENPYDWSYNIRNNADFDLSGIPPTVPRLSQLISLLRRMLQAAPKERPNVQQIMNDAFFLDDTTATTPSSEPMTMGISSAATNDLTGQTDQHHNLSSSWKD